jgi:outer membrane protein assembly factor BamB
LQLLWKRTLSKYPSLPGVIDGIISSPAIAADGTILVGAGDGLHAINAGGTASWVYPTDSPVDASPAIGVDGTIFVSESSGVFHAIKPDGTRRWSAPFGVDRASSPLLGPDGTLYVAAGQELKALSASGNLIWSFSLPARARSSPALTPDLSVVIGDEKGTLHVIDAPGVLRFSVALTPGKAIEGAPAIDGPGNLAIVGDAGTAFLLDRTGAKLASHDTPIWLRASPGVQADGRVIFAGNSVFTLDSSGKLPWETPLVSFSWGAPAIDAAGTIFLSTGFVALAFSPGGAKTWQSAPMGFVCSSPAIGGDGHLLVASVVSDTSVLFAYGP